jgi:hypothetical protein
MTLHQIYQVQILDLMKEKSWLVFPEFSGMNRKHKTLKSWKAIPIIFQPAYSKGGVFQQMEEKSPLSPGHILGEFYYNM